MTPTSRMPRPQPAQIAIVVPVFNEAAILPRLLAEIDAVFLNGSDRFELVLVNDGSTDDTLRVIDELASKDRRVRGIHLSRNFGQQAALQAGMAFARGDAVAVMDADLQDDPAALAAFVVQWRRGFDVVYAIRQARKESRVKRALFHGFYRLLNLLSATPMPLDAGNFGLVDAAVARQIADAPERDRYFPGLRRWVGYRQTGVPVERRARYDAEPRVSFRRLFQLAKTAIFSFSYVPLSIFYAIALLALGVFGWLTVFTMYHKLFTGLAIPGWTSNLMTASFFGAINALGIAVLGEYVARIHDQVRGRPTYIVARTTELSTPDDSDVVA